MRTWPCFNIDSQAEYSWKKTHVMYLVGSTRVLWVTQIERDHYWGSLPNTIDEIEPSTQGKTRLLLLQTWQNYSPDNARSHVAGPVKTKILRNTQMESSTPPAVFSRHCSLRLPLVQIDDAWTVWAALHIIWRYQKLYRWLDNLKRWSVFPTRFPTRKMKKSSG